MRKLTVLLLALLMIFPAAVAEEAAVTALPMNLTPGHVADPANFTETSYEDESLSITLEQVWVDDARFNVARVKIADPSQLRTALAHPKARTNNYVSAIADKHNAVIAINGDFFTNDDGGYVIRMGETFRKNPRKANDLLITDENGDLHIIKRDNLAADLKAKLETGITQVNVFNFGPALVIDGALQEMPESYKYNIHRKEPRCAIGQVGPLEYLLVVVDGRGHADSEGCTVQTLAQFMYDQGCQQAYNLDGGNSAYMYFGGEYYSYVTSEPRPVSDIIYFATAVDSGLDGTEE